MQKIIDWIIKGVMYSYEMDSLAYKIKREKNEKH